MLVVDDEPDMLDFLERTFRRTFAITRAQEADHAIGYLMNRKFDVLITDHKMPGSTGLEILEQITESHPDLIRVLLSGFTDMPDLDRALVRCKVAAFLVKPVDADRLRATVEDLIARRSPSGE
jgi:adenylate cyclase